MAIVCPDAVEQAVPQRGLALAASLAWLKIRLHRPALVQLLAFLKPPLLVFVFSRAVCFLAGYLALLLFHVDEHGWRMAPDNLLIDWTSRWDSGWYNSIVQIGYSFVPGKESSVAFFPLYPRLIRLVNKGFDSPIMTALVVDHLAFLGALIYLYALGLKILPDRQSAERSLWLLALFPSAFFFSTYYTESLFLFLSVGACYHVQRRQWVWAGLLASLASACRVPGIFLYGVLMLEWMKDAGWSLATGYRVQAWRDLGHGLVQRWRTLLLIQASVLGLAGYMGFLYYRFGHPLRFQHAHTAWGRHPQNPMVVIYEGVHELFHQNFWLGLQENGKPLNFITDFNLFCLLAGLALCISVWRKLGESYACYCLVSILVPACTSLMSMSRIVSVLFPLFMALSIHVRKPNLERAVLTIFATLLAILTALFATWRFVA